MTIRMILSRWIWVVACLIFAGAARADDVAPQTEHLHFDGQLNPHPGNRVGVAPREPGQQPLHTGDWLYINVDPARLFKAPLLASPPSGSKWEKPGDAVTLTFDATSAPPELSGFHADISPGLLLQPVPTGEEDKLTFSGCPTVQDATHAEQKHLDLTKLVNGSALVRCEINPDLEPLPSAPAGHVARRRLSVCKSEKGLSLGELLKGRRLWRVVTSVDSACADEKGVPKAELLDAIDNALFVPRVMLGEFAVGDPADTVTVQTSLDGGAWQVAEVIKDDKNKSAPQWNAKLPLTEGSLRVKLGLRRGTSLSLEQVLVPIRVEAVDSHSLVRVQAQLMASNRLRSVSFAVAVTPVGRAFFERGPWHCVLLCTVSPTVVVRLAGEDMTNFQVGFGLAVFATRYIQFNGGLLFGTRDISVGWNPAQAWFVGVGLDPFLLSEIKALNPGKKP